MPTPETTLRDVLISWLSIGPFRDDADVDREKEHFAAALSRDDLISLVDASLWLVRDGDTSAPGLLYELFERLIPRHGDALTDELLRRLEGDTLEEEEVVTVIELLGTLGSPRALAALVTLSVDDHTPVAVRVAAIDALSELTTTEADPQILALRALGGHPLDVHQAIERSIWNRRAKQASKR